MLFLPGKTWEKRRMRDVGALVNALILVAM